MIPPNVIFVVLMGCPLADVVNTTNEWTPEDGKALTKAEKTCEISGTVNPCLKIFTKTGVDQYSAVCGTPE